MEAQTLGQLRKSEGTGSIVQFLPGRSRFMFLCFPQKRGWRAGRRSTGSVHKPLLLHVSVAPTVYHRKTAEGATLLSARSPQPETGQAPRVPCRQPKVGELETRPPLAAVGRAGNLDMQSSPFQGEAGNWALRPGPRAARSGAD